MNLSTVALLLLFCLQNASGQRSEVIVADRPGFSTGTYTVAPGRSQLESGYQYTGDKTHTSPLLNFRLGVTESMEFELAWSGLVWGRGISAEAAVSDVSVGIKSRLYVGNHANLSFLALLSLQLDPTVALLWDYSPLYGFSPFGAFQFSSFISNGTRIHAFAPALGLSYALSDRLSGFAEYFSLIPHRGASSHSIDGGVIYLLKNDVQLDIHAGTGLNPWTNDFAGFGVAVRL